VEVASSVFTSAEAAEALFLVHLGPSGGTFGPYAGRAELRDGRWVVSRETVCLVSADAGVACPG
jgi:hypothetical protein